MVLSKWRSLAACVVLAVALLGCDSDADEQEEQDGAVTDQADAQDTTPTPNEACDEAAGEVWHEGACVVPDGELNNHTATPLSCGDRIEDAIINSSDRDIFVFGKETPGPEQMVVLTLTVGDPSFAGTSTMAPTLNAGVIYWHESPNIGPDGEAIGTLLELSPNDSAAGGYYLSPPDWLEFTVDGDIPEGGDVPYVLEVRCVEPPITETLTIVSPAGATFGHTVVGHWEAGLTLERAAASECSQVVRASLKTSRHIEPQQGLCYANLDADLPTCGLAERADVDFNALPWVSSLTLYTSGCEGADAKALHAEVGDASSIILHMQSADFSELSHVALEPSTNTADDPGNLHCTAGHMTFELRNTNDWAATLTYAWDERRWVDELCDAGLCVREDGSPMGIAEREARACGTAIGTYDEPLYPDPAMWCTDALPAPVCQ